MIILTEELFKELNDVNVLQAINNLPTGIKDLKEILNDIEKEDIYDVNKIAFKTYMLMFDEALVKIKKYMNETENRVLLNLKNEFDEIVNNFNNLKSRYEKNFGELK